ncbi:MAG TPA: transglycosylase domain-containing protein [Streptosporangiaceae bacterium]
MSNPDFPGPSWQDNSAVPDGSAAYGAGADPYGRAGDGRSSAGASARPSGRARKLRGADYDPNGVPSGGNDASYGGSPSGRARNGRGPADYDANGDPGYARNGDAGYGRNGTGGYGRNGDAGYGRNGATGYGRNGDAGYGREDVAGEDDLAGRIRRRLRDHGAGTEAGYEANGRGSAGSPRNGDRGYQGGRRRSDSYGSDGDAGYGDTGRLGGRSDQHGRPPASYRSGTGLIEDGPTALPGIDHGDLGGRGGPGGPVGPGRPYGPGGPGGPGRRGGGRGSGGGRRGPSGLVDPDGRRVRPPGNFWQRQWRASWWRRWTIKKAALVMGAMALGTVLILIAGFFYVYSAVQLPIKALSAPLSSSSAVYFADSKTEVGSFSATNRTVLTAEQLGRNKYLEQAFFAAEDRHFLTEGGISLTGTARALFVDLTGSGRQGGSTITEQYVKTYFESVAAGGNLTYKEKLKEIIYAIKLAKAKSKPWILTHYLNAIYLGSGAYGVEGAAETYFGKHAWQLDIGQCAMLAALVQAPSSFDPQMQSPGKRVSYLGYSLLDRWVSVLINMAGDTFPNGQPVLTQQQLSKLVPDTHNPHTALKNFPKVKPLSSAQANWSGFRGYIMTAVQTELERTYGYSADQISSAGLHIVTTFNLRKMRALYSAVAEAKRLMRNSGQRLPSWAHVGAILENPRNGAIEAMYGGPNFTARNCKKIACQYNTAMLSRNQVGSSFKPYVLAAAVKQGMNVATSKLNGTSPLCVPPDNTAQNRMTLSKPKRGACPPLWATVTPDNATRSGPVTVAAATAASSNPAFVDLAHRVGTQNIIDLAKQFGVAIKGPNSSNLQSYLGQTGIALGIASLTVEEQATTFATLANRGNYHTPHVIAKITQNGQQVPTKVVHRVVLTPKEAADVDWALSFDTNSGSGYTGTGTNAVLSPYRPTIAKTGTTDSSKSAFFLGALPGQYSFVVGMFTQDPSNNAQTLAILPSFGGWTGGYGGAWPATIWRLYMTKLLAMSHKPVASLDPLNVTGMAKWIQAKAPKPKCQQGQGGGNGGPGNGGGGNGNGHNHGHGIFAALAFGKTKCPPSQGGGPSPGPSTSGSPNPSPSGSGSPSPSPSSSTSPRPSASPSLAFPAKPAQAPGGNAPSRKQAASTPSLTTSVTLPRPPYIKPGWAVLTTGLI